MLTAVPAEGRGGSESLAALAAGLWSLPRPTSLQPAPWSLPLGSLAWGQLAQGSSQRADQAAGSEFKANFASTARSSAPGHSRAGRGRAVSKTVCSLAARQSPGDPCPGHPQPHLAPAARHLERSGSPPARGSPAARTHTHARQRARGPALMSAPPARAPPASLAHGSQDAPGIDAGARSARRIVSRLLYISSRAPGLGTRSGGSDP